MEPTPSRRLGGISSAAEDPAAHPLALPLTLHRSVSVPHLDAAVVRVLAALSSVEPSFLGHLLCLLGGRPNSRRLGGRVRGSFSIEILGTRGEAEGAEGGAVKMLKAGFLLGPPSWGWSALHLYTSLVSHPCC